MGVFLPHNLYQCLFSNRGGLLYYESSMLEATAPFEGSRVKEEQLPELTQAALDVLPDEDRRFLKSLMESMLFAGAAPGIGSFDINKIWTILNGTINNAPWIAAGAAFLWSAWQVSRTDWSITKKTILVLGSTGACGAFGWALKNPAAAMHKVEAVARILEHAIQYGNQLMQMIN